MNLQAKDIKTSGRPFQIGVGVKGLEAVQSKHTHTFIYRPKDLPYPKKNKHKDVYSQTLQRKG